MDGSILYSCLLFIFYISPLTPSHFIIFFVIKQGNMAKKNTGLLLFRNSPTKQAL